MPHNSIPHEPPPVANRRSEGGERPHASLAFHHSVRLSLPLSLGLLFLLTGCVTHWDRIEPVREAYFAGRLSEASLLLDKHQDRRLRNDDVKQLDHAMIDLTMGRPKEAERKLKVIRDKFDHNEQASLAEGAASLLTDDNAKAYAGEDYEKVLIRAFLAISNLMTDGGDVQAYSLQMTDKQDEIIRRVKDKKKEEEEADPVLAYKQVALGPYLRAMLAEESPLTLDDAERARVQVAEWAPEFRDAKHDLQRAKHEVPIAQGHGALYVFAMVGRGPVKEEVDEVATQVSLLIADRIVSAVGKRGLPPTIAPVKVPKVRRSYAPRRNIDVAVSGRPVGQTATLVDVGAMAEAQGDAHFPRIVAEAVARRVVKKAAIYAVKEGVDATPWSAASIGLSALGVAWEAAESADTRCWSLLPDSIQVLRIELPAGEHEIVLRPSASNGLPPGAESRVRVFIEDGRHACVLGTFPADRLVGELQVSGQASGGPGSSEPPTADAAAPVAVPREFDEPPARLSLPPEPSAP